MDPNLSSNLENLKKSYNNYVYVPGSDQGGATKLPLIQRVPFRLRSHPNSDKHYVPMIMAIGPIHHDKEHIPEEFKRGLAHLFINNYIRDTQYAYNLTRQNITELRKRYEEGVSEKYGDDDLAWMLFLDGCAVLSFIAKSVAQNFGTDFKMKSDFEAFGAHDLFLLENQLPFEVLKSLMDSSTNPSELKKNIEEFIVRCMLHYDDPIYIRDDLPERPNHLLELLRSKFLGHKTRNRSTGATCNPMDCVINLISKNKKHKLPTFRNITELLAAGIKVRKSRTSYLTDISFKNERSFNAMLKLPPMMVDDWTAPKFLNLIAYEMCPDFFNDFGISSYICFMDSLIDKAEDVKELRDVGVLHNSLGSDEEVAIFFNEISNDLVPNTRTYNDVKEKIQKHYQNKWMTWLAQFYHEHFSSPWTILASVAALIGLVLTALQTWDALKPSDDSLPKA